jgi:hypothetical protein
VVSRRLREIADAHRSAAIVAVATLRDRRWEVRGQFRTVTLWFGCAVIAAVSLVRVIEEPLPAIGFALALLAVSSAYAISLRNFGREVELLPRPPGWVAPGQRWWRLLGDRAEQHPRAALIWAYIIGLLALCVGIGAIVFAVS